MTENQIETIGFDEFQSIADWFIDRSAYNFGEMLVSSFFELLFEKLAEG